MANPPGQRSKTANLNVPSKLLSKSENDQVVNLLGRRCLTLATAVVQVFLSQPPNGWSKKCCGVACFVKDYNLRSYFIRVYDIVNEMKLWEQKLCNRCKYIVADDQPFFYTFETDTCWAALDFADDAEAGDFSNAIEAKLRAKMQRKEVLEPTRRPHGAGQNRPYSPRGATQINIQPSPTINTTTITSKKEDKKDQGKKADISTPSNFTHDAHCGSASEKGLDYNVMDPALQNWLETLGLNESEIQDEKNVEVINQFVDENGGINAIKDEVAQRSRVSAPPPPPPSPGSAAPPLPSRDRDAFPPPLPSRDPALNLPPSSRRGAPPSPSRAMPPTPPSIAPPSMLSRPNAGWTGLGPPPPPPFGWAVGAAPPPPPIRVGGAQRGRMGLVDDIHKGTTFKRVDPDDQTATARRERFLDQIRGGKALKKDKVMDQDLQNWLKTLGLDESQIQDKQTVEVINLFEDAIKEALRHTSTQNMGADQ